MGWPWSPEDTDTHLVFIPISLDIGVLAASMLTWGYFVNGQRMWLSFALVGILVMAHSILWIATIGMLIFPVSLGICVISVARLTLYGILKLDRA